MFIDCPNQGRVNDDYCGTLPSCPVPCQARSDMLRLRIEGLRKYQRRIIDRHKDAPGRMYYEVVAAVQDRIEALKAMEKMNETT